VIAQADVVGSTTAILKAFLEGSARQYIVATDRGLFHRMKQLAKKHGLAKELFEAPTAGESATCKSCAHCPWMAMNGLQGIWDCLTQHQGEINIDASISDRARLCIDRMLDFTANKTIQNSGGFTPNLGSV